LNFCPLHLQQLAGSISLVRSEGAKDR